MFQTFLAATIKNYFTNYSGISVLSWYRLCLTVLNALSIGVSFFLSLYFVEELHIDIAKSGLLISCYGFGTIIGSLLGGKLADGKYPEWVAITSLFFQGLCFLLLMHISSYVGLLATLLLLGIFAYGFKTSNNYCLLRSASRQQERLRLINISHAAANCGFGLAGVVIAVLVNVNFPLMFGSLGTVLIVISVFMIYQYVYFTAKGTVMGGEIAEDYQTDHSVFNLSVILLCVFLVGLIISQLSATYPVYIKSSFPELGMNGVSFLFILDTVLIVLFQAPLITMLQTVNKLFVVGLGALLMGLGMFILSFSQVFSLAIVSCIIWTLGEMLFIPMSQLVCYEAGSSQNKGNNLGAFQAAFAASTVIGPALGGLIYRAAGGAVLWMISGFIGASCFFLCRLMRIK